MTDQQLIDLLAQKTPEELTPDEIDLLRSRLAESPELRAVLFDQLKMETYLAAALGPISITPRQIVARAQAQTQPNSGGVLLVLAMLVALPLLLLFGAILVRAWQGGEVVADAKPADAADKPGEVKPPDDAGKDDTKQGQPRSNPLADAIRAAQGKPPLAVNPPDKQKTPQPKDDVATKSAVAPMAPVGPPPPPWQAVLDAPGEAPPLSEVSFQPFDPAKSLPQRDDLRAWFEQAPGHSLRFNKVDTRYGSCGSFEGMARLRSPWPEGAVLRLALENYNRLRLHFFHGDVGATFVYYEDENYRWVAYATTRDDGNFVPKTWAITGTDDQRAARSELRQGGPLELRYHAGEVILSRGDIVLTSAPLPGPPEDVLLEGRAAFEGIALSRTKDLPVRMRPGPIVATIDRPADLDWKSTRPEIAQPEKLANGSLRLAAKEAKEPVACFTPLPHRGLHEVILELADVSPGTGVYLCNEKGESHLVTRFYKNRRGGQLYATLRNADRGWERDFEPPQERPAAIVGQHCWIKLHYGCGLVRWQLSADGEHWAEPEMAIDSAPPRLTHVGLYVAQECPKAQVTLGKVIVRELSGLSALADPKLAERALAMPEMPAMGPWLAEVVAKQPADVASAEWLRACAIATLAAGAHRDLAYPLMEALLDDMAQRDLPLAVQQAALADALVMCWDYRDGGMFRQGIPRRILDLGLAQVDTSGAAAWSSVREAIHTGSMYTHLLGPLELERSIRAETIQRAYGWPAADTLDYCRRLRLFNQERYSPLIGWLESLAARELPGKPSGEGLAKIRDGWRDPLIEDLSKETYNATTEIQAVLESEAWPDAARLITSVDAEAAPGVAPYIRDRALLASLPVAVRLTLDDYPQVREALSEKFGPLARLRVGQAMSAGDAATVEMATVQFAGTDAAGEAHQWLGDRALASGWFERAISEYRRAIAALPALRSQVQPRVRLAAAMLGREEGEPVTQSVQFNDLSMPAAEFESLVVEMRNRGNAATLSPIPSAASANPLVPAARRYEAHVRSRLDGPVGDRPQEEVGERRTNQFRVPWADRQISTVVEGDVLYVGNHFQIAAYNLQSGQRMWQSQPPPGPMQRSQDWALIQMQPLMTGNRIFTRLLYSANPLLACLEKSSGKLLWTAEAPPREFFVSDPVIVQGQLGAVSVSIQLEQQGLLRWNTLDPETGEVQTQRDLVRLRNTWGKRACCELAPLADSVVAVLGGITLAFDPDGKVRWVRKHVAVPAEEDPRWILQTYQRPLLADGRMYVTQPGVRSVDCLDPLTGRQHWSVVMPELLGMVGLSGTSLVVRTERDLRALDRATGQTLWRLPAAELHSFQLVDDATLMLAVRERVPSNNDQWLTRLIWIDARTGLPSKTCTLPNLTDNDPRLGPLVPYKDRVFTFFGRGQHDPNRDVVELVPVGDAEPALTPQFVSDPWRQRVPSAVRNAAFRVLPDWQLTSGHDGDRTGLVPEIHGERDVLGVRSLNVHAPIVLAREITLPAMGRPRLRLRLGTDGGQVWKLEVRHGEQMLKTEEIKDETHPDRWKTVEVDLSPAAGKSGWLTVKLTCANGDHVLWLKGAEVVY